MLSRQRCRPHPAGPSARFGWNWAGTGRPTRRLLGGASHGPASLLRTAAAMASMAAGGGIGAGIGLLNGSRRQGINAMTSITPELALGLAGVTVSVRGEEHLWSHRPAVFIANHQSPADVLLLSRLVRRDFTGVAKRELARDPLFGPLARLTEVVFIDRTDSAQAHAALARAAQMLHRGISIVILPEGTRSSTPQPGPFKKDAFHLAVQAGVPLVPIVIRNAADVMAHDSPILHPDRVDVIVHAPIPVDGWTTHDLNNRITEIRQLYLDTLAHWPASLTTPAEDQQQRPPEPTTAGTV